ncbi:MAG: GNAT family N-acetyltransferase [Armatimonadota bacterium]|nr:GNAT family N-acetyltransferase [Armatimonadota bacterium]
MDPPLEITIRPYRDADAEAIARIHNAIFPDTPETAEEMRYEVSRFDPARYVSQWLVAETRPGTDVVGYGYYRHLPWAYHPHRYRLWVAVHPAYQRRGVGRRLIASILSALRARGAERVTAETREDFLSAVAGLRRFGFEERYRDFEARLDVPGVDLSPLRSYVERAARSGVTFTTLADEVARDASCLSGLYQAYSIMDMSAPREESDPPTEPPYDEWLKQDIQSYRTIPEAYFLAKMGDVYVGLSQLKRSRGDPTLLHQELTAVVPPFQGRGLAVALKVLTVEYAQRHGYKTIRTFNSSRNAAMLAINRKLGFRLMPAWIGFVKTLA